jgi:hypothetical protein
MALMRSLIKIISPDPPGAPVRHRRGTALEPSARIGAVADGTGCGDDRAGAVALKQPLSRQAQAPGVRRGPLLPRDTGDAPTPA